MSGPVPSLASLGLVKAAKDPLLKPLMPSNPLSDGGMAGSVLWSFHFPFPLSTQEECFKGHPSLGFVGRCGVGGSLFQPFSPTLLTSFMVGTGGLRTCFPRRRTDIYEAVTSHPPRQWPCVYPTGPFFFLSNLPMWHSPEVIN